MDLQIISKQITSKIKVQYQWSQDWQFNICIPNSYLSAGCFQLQKVISMY